MPALALCWIHPIVAAENPLTTGEAVALWSLALIIVLTVGIYTSFGARRGMAAMRDAIRQRAIHAHELFSWNLQQIRKKRDAGAAKKDLELDDAMRSYFADKLQLRRGDISAEQVETQLRRRGLSDQHLAAVRHLFESSQTTRSAEDLSENEDIGARFERVDQTIREIDTLVPGPDKPSAG